VPTFAPQNSSAPGANGIHAGNRRDEDVPERPLGGPVATGGRGARLGATPSGEVVAVAP